MSGPGLVYGANGFTGRRIVHRALELGLRPILAGRSREPLEALARETGLEARTVALEETDKLRELVATAGAVIHAAGPFEETWQPMVEACLETGCHYLDVTGEWQVFDAILALDERARTAGVALVPGVGFDVVPTDALAAMLASRLPDATHLELAFTTRGSASRGTKRTALRQLPHGGAARIDGEIRPVPHGWKQREVPFADRARTATSVAWGDIATAYRTTGIPNIVVYTVISRGAQRWMRTAERVGRLFGTPRTGSILERVVRWRKRPDAAATRREGECQIWGEVRNLAGRSCQATMTTPDGYALTADAATRAMARALAGLPPGAWTPARLFGIAFVNELEGTRWGR